MEIRKVSEIIWREDLYPRIKADPAKVQEYAEDIERLPAIEVNQHNELIDGFHRWTAHRKLEKDVINVIVTPTKNEAEFLHLAIERNASHGLQMSREDKSRMAKLLYGQNGHDKCALATLLSVSERTIATRVRAIDEAKREEQERVIREMWLSCRASEEIAEVVGLSRKSIDLVILEKLQKLPNLFATHQDADWSPQLYDIWNFAKNENHKHYGNTHVGIVDNLLYLFTNPFGIVIDPFAGGGATIDICKKRLRRYFVSDRLPVVERENEIRKHEATDIPGPYHWSDVELVYLDPPYWKQAAGKYSDDPEDLANMSFEQFTRTLATIINEYGKKLRPGAHVACIISPTQWPNEDKSTNYHDIDLINSVGSHLKLDRHIICPYSTEQYNGTQVNIAKERKLNMVISRRLIVWEVVK